MRRSHQLAKPASPLLLCLLLGCAAMISEGSAPYDWPYLRVTVHRVSFGEVQQQCRKYLTTAGWIFSLGVVGGCAEVNFERERCDVWLMDADGQDAIMEHELAHCSGHSHPGETTLADAWANYKASRR